MSSIAFFDIEVSIDTGKIRDIGCARSDGAVFHKNSLNEFFTFIQDSSFWCGHNIVKHDLAFLRQQTGNPDLGKDIAIDTLLLSPLLFPQKPYHRLLKDDKIQTDENNNPYNDSIKAKELFLDEVTAFNHLGDSLKTIFYNLLHTTPGFSPFFRFVQFSNHLSHEELETLIKKEAGERICDDCNLTNFIHHYPVPLAYALSLVHSNDRYSITPPWVLKNHPEVERLLFLMCNNPCLRGCGYCNKAFDPYDVLKNSFGFAGFRKYGDEPLQENAVHAAINNKSLLAIFPTGGGMSITFQVPALMSGRNAKALTVIISPLQSLLKDQVANLEKKGITEAVTINGLWDPIVRSKAIERVENGQVT